MSNLKDLRDLKKSDSFIQANFIKGFEFIDNAGKLINIYHTSTHAPIVEDISPAGLTLRDFSQTIDSIRISNNLLWIKFLPKNFTYSTWVRNFLSELRKVEDIIHFEKINRIGWRNYFVLEYPNEQYGKAIEKKLSFDPELQFASHTYTTEIRSTLLTKETDLRKLLENPDNYFKYIDFKATLRLEKVVSKEDKKNGLLIDIDLFKDKEMTVADTEIYLNSFIGYLEIGLIDLLKKL